MRYLVTLDGMPHTLIIEREEGQHWQVTLDDVLLEVDGTQIAAGRLSLIINSQSYEAFVREMPSDSSDSLAFDVLLDGVPFPIELVDERRRALAGMARGSRAAGEAIIKAPMPGLVAKVLVAPGDIVEHNQVVVVLEAMKMQNDLVAPRAGIVHAVKTEAGQTVAQNQPLVIIGDASDGSVNSRDPEGEN